MPPHSVVLSIIGAALLWVGWFGFNAGSALAADGIAANALLVTHCAGAAAALSWLLVEWLRTGKPTVLGAISGAVAGLAIITPASGFTTPMYALLIGAIGGIVCFFAATVGKQMMGYDDTLDAFGVHGVSGTVGTLLTGVFAVAAVHAKSGLVEGNSRQLFNQFLATIATWLLCGVGSLVLLKLTAVCLPLRVSESDEYDGLDLSLHGESGYNLEEETFTVAMDEQEPNPTRRPATAVQAAAQLSSL